MNNLSKLKKTPINLGVFYKYLLAIISLIIVIPLIIRYIRTQSVKNQVQTSEDEKLKLQIINNNPDLLNETLSDIENDSQLHTDAFEIYEKTGYYYIDRDKWFGWSDPRGWTEDEIGILNILKQYNPVPQQLIQSYWVQTNGRNFKADMLKIMTTNQFNQIKW